MKYITLLIWLITLPVCYILAILIQSTKELLSIIDKQLDEAFKGW